MACAAQEVEARSHWTLLKCFSRMTDTVQGVLLTLCYGLGRTSGIILVVG